MSSGWAAQTASIPSSSSMRPGFVARLRRIQVARVWPSSLAAFGASQGASKGTARAKSVEPPLRPLDVDEDRWVDTRDRAAVAAQAAAVLHDVVALAVCREGVDAELLGQRGEPVLRRADPLPAHLHDLAVADVVVVHAPADTVACLHDNDRGVARLQSARSSKARKPGAHNDNVGLVCPRVGHRA